MNAQTIRGHEDGGFPAVRSERDVLAAMRLLAQRCGEATSSTDPRPFFEEGLSLMLEIRVPRMPDTDEELAAMIDEAHEGPFLSADEAFERLREHSASFEAWLKHHRDLVDRGAWNCAGSGLAPSHDPGSPRWHGTPCLLSIRMDGEGGGSAVMRHDGATVEASSPIAGLAMLGAIMLAHDAWHEVWRR